MKKSKRGFTLVELMAVIAIFSILTMMIGPMMVQAQKIFNKADNKSAIQDEFRSAIMNIEKTLQLDKNNKIIVYKMGSEEKVYFESSDYLKEKQRTLICVLPEDSMRIGSTEEKIAYVQAEEADQGVTQLLEVRFANSDNEEYLKDSTSVETKLIPTSIKVLINKIEVEEDRNVKMVYSNGLLNIDVPGVSKNNETRVQPYSASIDVNNTKGAQIFDEDIVPEVEEEFLASINNNINVAKDVDTNKSLDFNGSLNHSEITVDIGCSGTIDKKLESISTVKNDINIKNIRFTKSNSNINVYKSLEIDNKEVNEGANKVIKTIFSQEPTKKIGDYKVYLVDGPINVEHSTAKKITNSIMIDDSIIISTGKMTIGSGNASNNDRPMMVNNSIIYCNYMYINKNKQDIKSDVPVSPQDILKSYAETDDKKPSTVGSELMKLLEAVGMKRY